MKKYYILLIFLILSNCGNEVFIPVEKPELISNKLDPKLLDCDIQNLKNYNVANLTDKQISEIILTYNKDNRDNRNCYEDVQAIKKINRRATELIESQENFQ